MPFAIITPTIRNKTFWVTAFILIKIVNVSSRAQNGRPLKWANTPFLIRRPFDINYATWSPLQRVQRKYPGIEWFIESTTWTYIERIFICRKGFMSSSEPYLPIEGTISMVHKPNLYTVRTNVRLGCALCRYILQNCVKVKNCKV